MEQKYADLLPMDKPISAIHIDTASIPDFRREELGRGALELVEQVFSMSGAEERYQSWLKTRRKNASSENRQEVKH